MYYKIHIVIINYPNMYNFIDKMEFHLYNENTKGGLYHEKSINRIIGHSVVRAACGLPM